MKNKKKDNITIINDDGISNLNELESRNAYDDPNKLSIDSIELQQQKTIDDIDEDINEEKNENEINSEPTMKEVLDIIDNDDSNTSFLNDDSDENVSLSSDSTKDDENIDQINDVNSIFDEDDWDSIKDDDFNTEKNELDKDESIETKNENKKEIKENSEEDSKNQIETKIENDIEETEIKSEPVVEKEKIKEYISLEKVFENSKNGEIDYINEMKSKIYKSEIISLSNSNSGSFFNKKKASEQNKLIEEKLDQEFNENYNSLKDKKNKYQKKLKEYIHKQHEYKESLFKMK